MFNEKEIAMITSHGIEPAVVESQLQRFASGFPLLRIQAVATVGNGIARLDDKAEKESIRRWNAYRDSEQASIAKMVPASGAASRMFKDVFAFVGGDSDVPSTPFIEQYFAGIHNFAFFADLNKKCLQLHGKDVDQLLAAGCYKLVAAAMLDKEGLNYGNLPKGLLKFHRAAPGSVHTPLEEHMEEGAQYAADKQRRVALHFTVSPEHRPLFERIIAAKKEHYEAVWGVTYDVTLSEQKASTDTIAAMADNTPYHDEQGNFLFRPAGHGALIENLNDLDSTVVFLKNIDNVVPGSRRSTTTRYKKVIAGYLIGLQQQIAHNLELLDQGNDTPKQLQQMLRLLEDKLCTVSDKTGAMTDDELAAYLRAKFNRPIRVCGVVKNEGEPGGGPYLAFNADGSYSPQILEAAQINQDDPAAVALMQSGTHFNPVDLVCYLRDYKGEKFDLKRYVDPETGLISNKSKNGVEIKALELPGLWNGSMSDWNTAFVEVPIETFNPVKTVNDLLKPEHQ